MASLPPLPPAWRDALHGETEQPYFRDLKAFLEREAADGQEVFPRREDIFRALEATAPDRVRVVLLGQDPYPTPGHAHGLCFSVRPEVRPLPMSLRNVYKELEADVGFRPPEHGNLESWARQGILLLNTVLTVRARSPDSHKGRGWERFTDRVIRAVDGGPTPVVFLLWGNKAKKKSELVTDPRHGVIESAHPSPLSVRKFRGCRCFSHVNALLAQGGFSQIDWQLGA